MRSLALERTFGSTALSYGSTLFPGAARELSRWQARAQAIPDATLRRLALAALAKRGNMQGAALFAVLAPRAHRARAMRALVAIQAAYNYLDTLAEQPCAQPERNGRRLHEALLAALCCDSAGAQVDDDYYALHPQREDGGYLLAMLETSRASLRALPSYPLVAPAARAAATRIVTFQSLNLGELQGSHEALARWSVAHTPPGSDLRWWELAAAAGSSLGVYALVGLAADPHLQPPELAAIERAYFPWIGSLHSLLDSVVDVAEDRRDGQRNLLRYYDSPAQAAARLGSIAARAQLEAAALARNHRHETILTAMTGYYLSAPEASAPEVRAIARSVTEATGPLASATLPLFKVARLAARATPKGLATRGLSRASG